MQTPTSPASSSGRRASGAAWSGAQVATELAPAAVAAALKPNQAGWLARAARALKPAPKPARAADPSRPPTRRELVRAAREAHAVAAAQVAARFEPLFEHPLRTTVDKDAGRGTPTSLRGPKSPTFYPRSPSCPSSPSSDRSSAASASSTASAAAAKPRRRRPLPGLVTRCNSFTASTPGIRGPSSFAELMRDEWPEAAPRPGGRAARLDDSASESESEFEACSPEPSPPCSPRPPPAPRPSPALTPTKSCLRSPSPPGSPAGGAGASPRRRVRVVAPGEEEDRARAAAATAMLRTSPGPLEHYEVKGSAALPRRLPKASTPRPSPAAAAAGSPGRGSARPPLPPRSPLWRSSLGASGAAFPAPPPTPRALVFSPAPSPSPSAATGTGTGTAAAPRRRPPPPPPQPLARAAPSPRRGSGGETVSPRRPGPRPHSPSSELDDGAARWEASEREQAREFERYWQDTWRQPWADAATRWSRHAQSFDPTPEELQRAIKEAALEATGRAGGRAAAREGPVKRALRRLRAAAYRAASR